MRESDQHVPRIPLGVTLRAKIALGSRGELEAACQRKVVAKLPRCLTHEPDAATGVRTEFLWRDALPRGLAAEVVDQLTRKATPEHDCDHAD